MSSYIPNTFRGDLVTSEVNKIFHEYKFYQRNTLFATSSCPDEINRNLSHFEGVFGHYFHFGGMAGIPFVGKSGFRAFSLHKPDDGNLFIFYSSHLGIDENGVLGSVKREGMKQSTSACGSAMLAYESIINDKPSNSSWDRQQDYVYDLVKSNINSINNAEKPLLRLSEVIYNDIKEKIYQILSDYNGSIALLGGIQLNTPLYQRDLLIVKDFSFLFNQEENIEKNRLLEDLKNIS